MKRIMRTLAISVGLSSVLAVATPQAASAQEANGFGEKGELIISADRLLPLFSYSSESVSSNQNGVDTKTSDSATSVALLLGREPSLAVNPHTVPRIAIDYTVINHLTVGGTFVLGGLAIVLYAIAAASLIAQSKRPALPAASGGIP